MKRRALAIFCLIILCFSLMTARVCYLTNGGGLAAAANQQSTYLLDVASTRGTIYDCNLKPLTGQYTYPVAAVMPNPQAAAALLEKTGEEDRDLLVEKLEGLTPFTWNLTTRDVYSKGVQVFEVRNRYNNDQLAVHIIGQTDPATGKGATGIEMACDDYLSKTGGELKVRYTTDAVRRPLAQSPPEIINTGYDSGAGVVLTLDADIQRIAEKAAQTIRKGAVVVMDPYTGNILASVSRPTYNPNDIAASMNDPDAPLINRPFYAYSVGSTFKLLVAATALEQGYTTDFKNDCKGYTDIGEQRIYCHNHNGHGVIDMKTALEKSCNSYFIALALRIGGPSIAYKASELGFGRSAEFLPGYRTQSGQLPTNQELASPAATANLGFGQGSLLATPIQMATLVSSIANGGNGVTPRLVEGYTEDGAKISSHTPVYAQNEVFQASAANQVKDMMVSVVDFGSGIKAKPETGGAGGKTASAQTGQYENGEEIVHAWFAGFFPADRPRYVIVVLNEGGDSGSDNACPVFKEIADGINELGR